MDADQLDLEITGHVVTPGHVLEDGWLGGPMAERCDARAGAAQEPVPAYPAVGSALAEAADRTGRLAP